MGMFTRIIHPVTGEEVQIKTGNDYLDTYMVGSVIPWEPDPGYPGHHIDGVYKGLGDEDERGHFRDYLVVIKNCTVVAVVDKADTEKWEDPYKALTEEYGIVPPDAALWPEDAWERFREAEARAKAEHDAWELEAAEKGYTDSERMAFLMGKLIGRRMDYNSIGRQVFSVEPIPNGLRFRGGPSDDE